MTRRCMQCPSSMSQVRTIHMPTQVRAFATLLFEEESVAAQRVRMHACMRPCVRYPLCAIPAVCPTHCVRADVQTVRTGSAG
jgi:hypothetical protein